MKTTLVLALLLVSSIASAETITLLPSGCFATRNCIAVNNDGVNPDGTPVSIAIAAAPQYTQVSVYLDGVLYQSPVGNSMGITGLDLTAADGSVIVLTAAFSATRVCNRSGRGQSCHNNYVLTSGSLTR